MRRAGGGGCGRGCLIAIGVFVGLLVVFGIIGVVRILTTPESERAQAPSASQAEEVEVSEALAQGLITMSVRGTGSVDRVKVAASLQRKKPINLVIPAGTMFLPGNATTQSMVAVRRVERLLDTREKEVAFEVPAACANMHLSVPHSSSALDVSAQPASGDLAKLVSTPGFQQAGVLTRQWAVWTITDNPTPDGYVGLGSFGVGSGPDPVALQQVKALFEEAGIDTSKYRALH